ncbi:porin [Pelomicrobium sp.]|jgi:predicted porin|uniref:porin n=1 Tax=Pelomicrobium sp. TaxID=2815319 RepID=UPI002FDCE72E
MNKKVIALAVAGALAAPLAAQAADNVTIYGTLNMSLESVDNDNPTDARRTRVNSNSSNIGFKGEEDLGGGLKAWFQVENDVRPDASTSGAWAGRNSAVGLSGNWGSVLLGNWDTPYKVATIGYDRFYATGMPDIEAVIGNNNGVGGTTAGFSTRQGSTVQYWSPKFAGFSFRLGYAPDEAETAAQDRARYSLGASYEWMGLGLDAAYEKRNEQRLTGGQLGDDTAWKVGVRYTFNQGNTFVGAVWENLKYENVVAAGSEAKRDAWGLVGSHRMGNFDLRAQWFHADDVDGGCAGGTATSIFVGGMPGCGISDSGADHYTVGVGYHFSKRTVAYAYYTKIKNDTNAGYDFAVNGAGSGAAGRDPSAFALHVRHSF